MGEWLYLRYGKDWARDLHDRRSLFIGVGKRSHPQFGEWRWRLNIEVFNIGPRTLPRLFVCVIPGWWEVQEYVGQMSEDSER